MGKGLTDLQPQQGFAAQTSAATVILASSHLGFSLSTTHSVSGAVMGAGLGRKGGVVRWSTATRMFVAWGLTLPAAALVGALAEWVTNFGDWGTALVAVFLVSSSFAIWKISRREIVDHTNVNDVDDTDGAESPGVVTAAMAAVTPPPTAAVAEELAATIPAPAGAVDPDPKPTQAAV
jgi:PiT family inorganic phosphate transporter